MKYPLTPDAKAAAQVLTEAWNNGKIDQRFSRKSKLGKVISELGRCLQHGANAVVVTQAIAMVIPFLQHAL